MAILAAVLRENGHSVRVLDAKNEHSTMEQIQKCLLEFKPTIIALTAFSEDIYSAARVAKTAKYVLPGVRVLIGGPHSSAIPKETLEEFPAFDAVVIGEGENTLLEIANQGGFIDKSIPGLAFRTDSRVILSPPRPIDADLNRLPFPAWDLFNLDLYRNNRNFWLGPKKCRKSFLELHIQMTRGCPGKCLFCFIASGHPVRSRSPEKVVEEMEFGYRQYGARYFYFCDGSFGAVPGPARRLCTLLIEKGLSEKIRWSAEIRADIDTGLLNLMKQSGCDNVGIGAETGAEDLLRHSGKGISIRSIRKVLKEARNLGIGITLYFIIGHPHETPEQVVQSFELAKKCKPDFLNIGIMIPFPGTRIYRMAEKGNAYQLLTRDWSRYHKQNAEILAHHYLSRKNILYLQSKSYLLYYLNPRRAWKVFKTFPPWKSIQIIRSLLSNLFSRN
jgi:radical SAM superfamily enzyme YgiQ (UPF0313 family)